MSVQYFVFKNVNFYIKKLRKIIKKKFKSSENYSTTTIFFFCGSLFFFLGLKISTISSQFHSIHEYSNFARTVQKN